jgi:polar amino acid transport system substrate-binding protein
MSIKKLAGAAFVVAAMVAAWAGIAKADALDDIISRGTIRVAIDTAAPPFGFMNENNEPDGSDVVSARLLAQDLGVKLEIVRTTSSNRIPYLTSGRVDLTMSTLALNPERAKAVMFSSPYAIIRAVILAPKSVKIETPADLAGKKISVPRGTTNETDAVAISPPGAEIIRFDDEAGAMTALASGQVDAYSVGEPLGLPLIKRYPERGYEAKIVLRLNYICVGIRRDQPEVAQWVNTWIHYHLHNDGQLKVIYKKFIGQELPPLPPL